MKNLNSYLLVALTLLLSSCESLNSYHPYDKQQKEGYEDLKLEDDLFAISFLGKPKTSVDRAFDMAVLRAAELTIEQGFTHFELKAVENRSTASLSQLGDEGTFSAGRPAITQRNGPSGAVYSQTPTEGIPSYESIEKVTPRLVIVIKCSNYEGPPSDLFNDATKVSTDMRDRYKIEKNI